MSSRSVYVHVGLPKTGTTYLQQALWLNRDQLAGRGVLTPGESQAFHKRAVWDLFGRRARGADERNLTGSWQELVDQVNGAAEEKVVISEESLVYARPRHVRQLKRAFEPAELHVVLTVRDLGRLIGSAWQHELTKGQTWTWSEFLESVHAPESGSVRAGVGFWLRYDIRKVISAWEAVVAPERIHVVVVPQPGAAPSALLQRFATALGTDFSALTPPDREANISIGVAEAEVLRRLNTALNGRLNERQYVYAVKGSVVPALSDRTQTSRIRLPDEHHEWAVQRSKEWIAFLQSRPFHVVGDVDELIPRPPDDRSRSPEHLDEAELASATADALVAAVERHARLWWRVRRQDDEGSITAKARLTSAARVLGFKARIRALELADRNEVFGKAAARYMRRSSSRSREPHDRA